MIKTDDAIRIARAQLGTPYDNLDCINLIKRVIRTAPGGDPSYTTAGTNALWKSYDMSSKYKDLTWRRDGLAGAQAGMIAFKASGDDYHHAGLITRDGTVIHASSVYGKTVETPLTEKEGWTHIAQHRHIAIAADVAENEPEDAADAPALFRALVITATGALNLREANAKRSPVIATIPKGTIVPVYDTGESMWRVGYGGQIGWAAAEYLTRHTDSTDGVNDAPHTSLIREDGTTILLAGRWRVAED